VRYLGLIKRTYIVGRRPGKVVIVEAIGREVHERIVLMHHEILEKNEDVAAISELLRRKI
jgi:hypothetical protein